MTLDTIPETVHDVPPGIDPLLAHLMLNATAAVCGAAGTLREHRGRLDDAAIDDLLDLIVRRARALGESARALAANRPVDALAALTAEQFRT